LIRVKLTYSHTGELAGVMSRPWGIEFRGALYHILSRGNEQKDVFPEVRSPEIILFPSFP
jgi:hypothetical protein